MERTHDAPRIGCPCIPDEGLVLERRVVVFRLGGAGVVGFPGFRNCRRWLLSTVILLAGATCSWVFEPEKPCSRVLGSVDLGTVWHAVQQLWEWAGHEGEL